MAEDGEDFLFNYTRAVVWEGLYHMARRDAIQEGDGDAMADFWRMDLVLLWNREHLQLFNSSHHMITGTAPTSVSFTWGGSNGCCHGYRV